MRPRETNLCEVTWKFLLFEAGPHLHLLDQRVENYALFPAVSRQKPLARRRRHAAPADRAELNVVGLAMRAGRKVIDKIVDGLKFHC